MNAFPCSAFGRKNTGQQFKMKENGHIILSSLIYDLCSQDKVLRITFCSYSLDDFAIQNYK
jgi:hypothetical protein